MGAQRARRVLRHGGGLRHQVPGAAGLGDRAVQPQPPRGADHRRGAEPVDRGARGAPDAHQHQFQQGRASAVDPDGPARAARDDHPPRTETVRAAGYGELPHPGHGPRDHARLCAPQASACRRLGRRVHRRRGRTHLSEIGRRSAARQQAGGFRHGLRRHIRQVVRRRGGHRRGSGRRHLPRDERHDHGGRRMKNDIRFYWRLVLRRLPVMLAIIILFTALALVQAVRLPAVFETEARLLVESPQISDNLVDVTVTTSADEEITIIRERLLTRANMLSIANQFNVFEDYDELAPDTIVALMQDMTSIQSRGGRNEATVITVGFEARSGQIAADVVNEYVTRIIAANVELRTGRAEGTLDFFETEVERLSNELATRSARISQFQAENADALPADQAFRLGRQAVLQERVSSAQRELSTLIDQRARIIAIYEATGQITATDNTLTDDQRQLRNLERELAQQLSIYSEDAPQIVTLRRRIDTLRTQVATTSPQDGPGNSGQAVLDMQLGQIDAQIESLESVISEAEAELVRLEDAIARAPINAITLQGLERNYENIRAQYDSAVSRLAQASTGERIELTARGQRITLIESASVPSQPARPNRRLMAVVGVAAGIGLAASLFILLRSEERRVGKPVEIGRSLRIEPLATVPYISTRAEH